MKGDVSYEDGKVLDDILIELESAREKYPAFHSCHEGLAVLEEEVTELRALVHINKGCRPTDRLGYHDGMARKMRREAIQIAAMAMRFARDLCDAD